MKKVLAWAVALALVLSSFTMAFAADTANSGQFKDADQIYYKEAVDVMVATKVIGGYPDGTFQPLKTVSRAEMAKMISVMLCGGEDIGDTFKGACTFADSKNHWAAGNIAYCASAKPVIINGRSASVFDPDSDVTGTEVAKMALCALGYDPQIQGYVGADWAANVLKDAKKVDLFDGLKSDFVPSNPCSREEAAQILFNTMKSTMVEYDTTTAVQIGDATVTVNSKVKDQTWPAGSTKDDNGDTLRQLYEDAFDGKLNKTPSTADDFGRPAHSWSYDKEDVGTYEDEADDTFIADDNFDDAAAAVKDFNKDYKVGKVTLNGDPVGSWTETKVSPRSGQEHEYSYNISYGGVKLGDQVELFETSEKNVYDVVIVRYIADRVEEATTDVSKKDADDDIQAYVTLTNGGQKKVGSDDPAKDLPGYSEATFVEDAVIAVALGGFTVPERGGQYTYTATWNPTSIIDSYVLDKEATGEWTRYTDSSITVAGTAYDKIGTWSSAVEFDNPSAKDKDEVDVYLINDYAAAIVKVSDSAPTLYGVLLNYGSGGDFNYGKTKKVQILTANGDVATFEVNKDNGFTPSEEVLGTIVAYTDNGDNTIDFVPADMTNIIPLNGEDEMTDGILAGYEVLDDVAVFEYTGTVSGDGWITDVVDEENYDIYSKSDLETAEDVKGNAVINKDGDMAAVMLSDTLTSKDTFIAILSSDKDAVDDGEDVKIVTLLKDGESQDIFSTKRAIYYGADAPSEDGTGFFNRVVKVTVNGDGNITKIENATPGYSNTPKSKFDSGVDYVVYSTDEVNPTTGYGPTYRVVGKDNKAKKLDLANEWTVNVSAAVFYKVNTNQTFAIEADDYTISDIAAATSAAAQDGSSVMIMQFNEGSKWDVVAFN